jgi:hypothetical protein
VDESDLSIAIDQIEVFLQSADKNVGQAQKMALRESHKLISY